MGARERHIEDLSGSLRARLIERRRTEAAAGRTPVAELADEVRDLVAEQAALLGDDDRAAVETRIVRDTVGLGPLEDLLADPAVEEVMVNGPASIYVERAGKIEATSVRFGDEEELRNAIERILAPLGRRIDELSPMVDARLADGSRVNVVIPPLAIDGPALSIRRFGVERPGPGKLVELGTLSSAQCELLQAAVARRSSLLISGGTGSGKTTLLNALSSFIAPGERVVTIEDAAELRLQQPHVVRLESRPASVEGRGEVTVRDLLRNALADAAGPDRDRRGAWGGGARPADRAQHRPRRRPLYGPRQLSGRCARPARDPGADGGRGAAARGDRRAGAAGDRPRRSPRATARRRPSGGRDRRGRASGGGDRGARPRLLGRTMIGGPGPLLTLAGAAAGGLAAVGAREAVLATPALARWVRVALEPLNRAGREGYSPSVGERRRLAVLGAGAAILGGWFLAGATLALPLAVAGPALAGWAIKARRKRYRRAVERALPDVALAVADSLSAGRSLRASLPAAAASLDGPPAVELARLGAELDLGAATGDAVAAWRRRMRSPRVDAFAAALLSQRLAGGDLAGLLRRFAEGAAERDRAAEDARAATSQARFTGLLVVAMPSGGALFAELLQPGFLAKVLGGPASATLLALAAALQLAGFVAIRRLSQVAA